MPEHEDHEQLSERLQREADKLQRESEHLGQEIGDTRSDWEAKRQDPKVAGANPPAGDESPAEDEDKADG